MATQSIIIADALELFREGVRYTLSNIPGYQVVQVTGSASGLITAFEQHPDALCIAGSSIQDMNIRELLAALRKIDREPKLIVVNHSSGIKHLDIALKTGVNGYITRYTRAEELVTTVSEVLAGKNYYCKSVTNHMIGKYKEATSAKSYTITKREQEILGFIVKGNTSSEIAKKLYISPRTVETHRANLLRKLKLKNTAALVRYAVQGEHFLKNTEAL